MVCRRCKSGGQVLADKLIKKKMKSTLNLIAVDFNPFGDGKKIVKIISTNEPQREIWLSCLIGGKEANLSYNESVSLQFSGELNYNALKKAIDDVILRHESLRSTLSPNGEKLIVYDDLAIEFELKDISNLSSEEKVNYITAFKHKVLHTEFDLINGPLFRAYLQKLDESSFHFTIILHHIVCDGWSTGIILEDIAKYYNAYSKNKTIYLENPAQISDYIISQNTFVNSNEHHNTLDFWLKTYENTVPVLNLITDYPRQSPRTYASNRFDYQIPISLVDKIQLIGAQAGCTLVTTLLAAFEIFLFKKTNQNEIVVGLPSSGQSAFELYDLVGHCVNLLPLKSTIDSEKIFSEYLSKRKTEVLDAYDHQKLTFGELVQKLYIPRDPSRVTLVPVVFNIDLGMTSAVFFDDLDFRLSSNPRGFEHFEIFLNATGSQHGLTLEWSYNTGLFKTETITKFNKEYLNILEKIAENPSETISSIIQKRTNNVLKGPEITIDENILDLLKGSNEKYPGNKAVTYKSNSITYLELNNRSNQIARYLIESEIKVGDVVALSTDRNIEMLIVLLGIMKSGATYLPIDPEFPTNRVEYMLQDSSTKLILLSEKYKNKFHTHAKQITIEDVIAKLDEVDHSINSVKISFDDIAYILYTSGSTGMPKGTKITHQNFANFAISMVKTPGIHFSDKILAITTVSFDISYLELIVPLTTGAEIVIANAEDAKDGRVLLEMLENENISILQATPSRWQMLLDCGWTKKYDLKIFTGGEALTKELAEKLLERSSEIWNMYAPTETTIYSIVKKITHKNQPVTIGLPINNTSVYILNENNNNVPNGVIGEICIGGAGVANGYLNQPKLTDEKFIIDPFSLQGTKMYKTGDLGKISEDGEIICLGREDNQVKIRGYRIELGEIESLLLKQDGIQQAVVLAIEDQHGDKKLVAYLIIDSNIVKTDLLEGNQLHPNEEIIKKWKNNLIQELPLYMLPDNYIIMDKFPLTPNAKIDRKSFPKPNSIIHRSNNQFNFTVNERLIAEIWSEVLDLNNLVPTDDFFELGGHSLIAVKVMVDIEKATGVRLPLAILFENSTIQKLALQLDKNECHEEWNSLIPIKKSGKKPPLYFIHGQGMNIIVFKSLLNEIENEQPLYGIQPKGLNPEVEPLDSIESIAADYVREIVAANPDGPYSIVGYSAGGVIALEMVNQFQLIGKKVSFVGLLDTYYDGATYWQMFKELRFIAIFSFTFNAIIYAIKCLIKYPRAYLEHKMYFIYGTLYNFYKKLNPIKKDLSNPKYVLHKIQSAHKKALNEYKISPIHTDIHLFQANDKVFTYIVNMDSNGWKPYVNGKFTKISVPLEHLQFFDPAYVGIFAKILQQAVNNVQKPN